MFNYVILIVILVLLFYLYSQYKLSYWKRKGVKTLPTHLIFGNFHDAFTFKKSPAQVLEDIYHNSDPNDQFVGFYIFHTPVLLIKDLTLAKQIFVRDFDSFPNRRFGGNPQKDSVGLLNLLAIHQPRWKYLRQKLTPAFSAHKLKRMIPLMQECEMPMLDFLAQVKENQDGWKKLDLKVLSSKYITDVISSLAFGITTNSFDDDGSAFWEAGNKILSGFKRGIILITLFYIPGLAKCVAPFMTGPAEYFRSIFWDSIEARERNQNERGDFMDFFLDLKNGEQNPDFKFGGDNLLGQPVSFFVAGMEATSTAISFSLYELSLNQEMQSQLYLEIIEIFPGGELNFEDVNKMVLLDQIVNEALRMYPPLPIIDRVANENYQIPGTDLVIDRGTPVYASVTSINCDSKYFDDPSKFVPHREWKDKSSDLPTSCLTFGLGPRTCIGQRLGKLLTKIALITILKEYTVSNIQRRDGILNPVTVFTAAIDGVNVYLKKRNSS